MAYDTAQQAATGPAVARPSAAPRTLSLWHPGELHMNGKLVRGVRPVIGLVSQDFREAPVAQHHINRCGWPAVRTGRAVPELGPNRVPWSRFRGDEFVANRRLVVGDRTTAAAPAATEG